MAGKKGKVAAEKHEYSVTETITVTVSMTRELTPLGTLDRQFFWAWTILVEGKVRFSGADLVTTHNSPTIAALDVLYFHCPVDGKVPGWFKGEANASQKNWFKITGPRMAPVVGRISTIGQYPGAQVITSDGLIPFNKDGIAVNVPVSQLQGFPEIQESNKFARMEDVHGDDDVVMGEVSEGVRRAIDASENRDRSSGNVAALTPPLLTSPFSG